MLKQEALSLIEKFMTARQTILVASSKTFGRNRPLLLSASVVLLGANKQSGVKRFTFTVVESNGKHQCIYLVPENWVCTTKGDRVELVRDPSKYPDPLEVEGDIKGCNWYRFTFI